ncbi:MAG: AAA family ATPase [Rhodothermaceae bacterium]|nr:AAA family ATPase [Rhodothermaceae bacterium]
MQELKNIKIKGFKSIKDLDLNLGSVNILIGSNGAGKSNFISFFRMLNEVIEGHLQLFVGRSGGANAMLHYGAKVTSSISARLYFGRNGYEIQLIPTLDDKLIFGEEFLYFETPPAHSYRKGLGRGHKESLAPERYKEVQLGMVTYVVDALRSWKVYHFHDTSSTARIKQTGDLHENDRLKHDAGNLAAFLFMLQERHSQNYKLIRGAVRQIFPRFKDFALRPSPLNPDKIRLEWQEHGSNYRFGPHQLSDGTLRFMGLATLLLQPNLPSTLLIDEPELGLHPSALTLLAGMVRSASSRAQLILTTQSVSFLNEFEPEDIITVERGGSTALSVGDFRYGLGESIFRKHDGESLQEWLNAYSLGELWEMNVLGARP